MTVLTASVSLSGATISVSVPPSVASTSMLTLSVSTSNDGSPVRNVSTASLYHRKTFLSVMVSPSCGMTSSEGIWLASQSGPDGGDDSFDVRNQGLLKRREIGRASC